MKQNALWDEKHIWYKFKYYEIKGNLSLGTWKNYFAKNWWSQVLFDLLATTDHKYIDKVSCWITHPW